MVDYTADDNLPPPDPGSHAITPSVPAQQQAHAAANAPDPRDNLPAPATGSILNTSGTSISDVVRKLGIGTRDVVTGLSSLPTAVADVATWPMRAAQRAVGIPTDAPSTLREKALDAAQLPTPQTPTEQNISTFNRGASAALTPVPGIGALPAMGAAAAHTIGPLVRTAVQGGTGAIVGLKAAASDLVPEWAKPTVDLLGNLIGAKGADIGANLVAKPINAIAGNTSDLYNTFQRLGLPTNLVGTVGGGEAGQSAEAALSRVPFASSILRPAQQRTVDAFGNTVENTASKLDPTRTAVTAQTTGETVQNAARDWKDNIFPAQQKAVWDPLNTRMTGASVDLTGYGKALDDVVTKLSLPETQKLLTPGLAMQLRLALTRDVPSGSVQWGTAGDLRSAIGQMMGVPEIAQSVGMDALKKAYGGIASDMRNTAAAHGQDAAFDAANKVSTDGHAFINGPLSKVISTNNAAQETIQPEQVTRNLLNGGDTTLQAIRDRMPDAADQLAAYNLRQAQLAKPGTATAYDDTSTGTFLTNINRLRQNQPGGYDALYQTPDVRQNLDDLTTAAGRLRTTERHLNTSGTAESLGWMGYLKGIYDAAATGSPGKTIGATVIPPGVGIAGGRIMSSPLITRLAAARNAGPSPVSPGITGLLGSLPQLEAGQ